MILGLGFWKTSTFSSSLKISVPSFERSSVLESCFTRFSFNHFKVSFFLSSYYFFFSCSKIFLASSYCFFTSWIFLISSFFLSGFFIRIWGGATTGFFYSSLPSLYLGSLTFLVGYIYQGTSFWVSFDSKGAPPVAFSTKLTTELTMSDIGQSSSEGFFGLRYFCYQLLWTH